MERAAGARWPCAGERLPPELQDIVKKEFDASPITLEKARQYQKELMEEHSTRCGGAERDIEMDSFNLCEH